jgi:hypothetical protein
MSGYNIFLLVDEAETKEEAKKHADGVIDDLFEVHDLFEGDHGYVSDDAEILCLNDVGEAKLRELNKQRAESAKHQIQEVFRMMKENGIPSLEDVPLCEVQDTNIGYALYRAAQLIEGFFCPYGIVYDPENHQCGLGEERIKQLMAEPDHVWLVEATVG